MLPLKDMVSEGEERTFPFAITLYKCVQTIMFRCHIDVKPGRPRKICSSSCRKTLLRAKLGDFRPWTATAVCRERSDSSQVPSSRRVLGRFSIRSEILQIRKDPLTFEPGTVIARLRGCVCCLRTAGIIIVAQISGHSVAHRKPQRPVHHTRLRRFRKGQKSLAAQHRGMS